MSKDELICTLLGEDLNRFYFSVWVRYNEFGELEYLITRGAKSTCVGYERLMIIGGIPDFNYTFESVEYSLVDALDC